MPVAVLLASACRCKSEAGNAAGHAVSTRQVRWPVRLASTPPAPECSQQLAGSSPPSVTPCRIDTCEPRTTVSPMTTPAGEERGRGPVRAQHAQHPVALWPFEWAAQCAVSRPLHSEQPAANKGHGWVRIWASSPAAHPPVPWSSRMPVPKRAPGWMSTANASLMRLCSAAAMTQLPRVCSSCAIRCVCRGEGCGPQHGLTAAAQETASACYRPG